MLLESQQAHKIHGEGLYRDTAVGICVLNFACVQEKDHVASEVSIRPFQVPSTC